MTPQEEIDAQLAIAKAAIDKATSIADDNNTPFSFSLAPRVGAGVGWIEGSYGGWYGTLEDLKDIVEDEVHEELPDADEDQIKKRTEELLAERIAEWATGQQTSGGTFSYNPNSGFSVENPWIPSSLNC